MSAFGDDASLGQVDSSHIATLAKWYDDFANALDPFSPARDQAERLFLQEIRRMYDGLADPKPLFTPFQNAVIVRCRRHLKASDRPGSV